MSDDAGSGSASAGSSEIDAQKALEEVQEKAFGDALQVAEPQNELKEPKEPPKQPHNLDKALAAMRSGNVADMASAPLLRLASLRIEGAKDVRPSFLLALCRPYVDPLARTLPWADTIYGYRTHVFVRPGQRAPLGGILQLTQSLGADLSAFDLFKDVNASIVPSTNPLANPMEDVDIVLECVKKSRVFLKSSTDIGNGEGTASVQGRFRNIFGGAETLEGSATFGTRTKQAFNLLFNTPLLASPVLSGSLAAFTFDRDISPWSSSFEFTRGLRAALLYTGRPATQHELAYEASWRHLSRLLPDASASMRKLSGHSLKAAVTHTWIRDTRDDSVIGSEGVYLKTLQELAGLGGDTNFAKVEGEVQLSRQLPYGLAWSFANRIGLLRTLDGRPSLYADRFQLGGPTCLRMFRQSSLGPKNGYDSLGGDAFWSAGLSLFAPFPRKPEWPLKLHAFVNAGQLCQLDQRAPLLPFSLPGTSTSKRAAPISLQQGRSAWHELLQPSVTTGVGLLLTQGALRVELNAGVPLVARRGDGMRKGLQFGIGIHFL